MKELDGTATVIGLWRTGRFLRRYWWALALIALVIVQIAINLSWLSTNVMVVGWDRPRHLIESLVYNEMLTEISLRSLFEAFTYSGYYPPLFHLSMVAFYKLFAVSMDVAALVNMVYLIILLVSAFGIGQAIGGKGAGLLTAFATSTMPMIIAMSRYTYIEFSLSAMVALSMWLLLLSQGFSRKGYSLLFGLSLGLGLLSKWTFSLFVFPALIVVILRGGQASGLRKERRSFSVEKRWLAVAVALGLILTLIWYLPNAQRVAELPLSLWLVPISCILFAGLIYLLKQPSHRTVNLISALWLGLVVAGSWYLSRVDFVNHTFFIAWGRPERHTWAFGYYLHYLTHEQFSLLYMFLLLLTSTALLIVRRKDLRSLGYWRKAWRSDLFLLTLWIVVPYLVFSFRPSSRHSRFMMPILPAGAAVIAYGLSKIRSRVARILAIAGIVLLAGLQSLVVSFDGLAWVREAAVIHLPVVGQVHIFASEGQNQLPSYGDTDSRFWIVPDVLDYVVTHGRKSQPVQLGLLVNTQHINEQHFQYLIYTNFQGQVQTRELALNLANEPVYPQLFEMDYLLLMPNHLQHRIDPGSLKLVETLLNDPPAPFQEAFRLAKTYELPDDSRIHLYERRYALPPDWSYEASQALAGAIAVDSGLDDAIIIFPGEQINLLGPYYEGAASLYLPSEQALDDEQSIVAYVEEILARHPRVFTLTEGEGSTGIGSSIVESLNQRAYLTKRDWYGSTLLTLYAAPRESESGIIQRSVGVDLGEDIVLVGYSLSERDVQAGTILRLAFLWQARNRPGAQYRVFVHLLGSEGGLVGWTDSEPVGGSWPTTAWRAGQTVVDNHGLLVPGYAMPGRYDLVVGMYLAETGERLTAYRSHKEIGDQVLLEEIRVSP